MIAEMCKPDIKAKSSVSSSFQTVLSRSFLVASLLTNDAAFAEGMVREAIDLWDPKGDDDELFRTTVKLTVKKLASGFRTKNRDAHKVVIDLPEELRSLTYLSHELRSCFVLRVLVGLPSSTCAHMLSLSACEIERNSLNAIENLIACCCK